MAEIYPLYYDPSGQIKRAKAGDTLPFPIQSIEVEYVTLHIAASINTCCIIVDQTAIPVNSVNMPLVNYRNVPFIDCIILEAGNAGDRVRAAITHGKVYDTPVEINYIDSDILYLGKDSLLTVNPPSIISGDRYKVIVGRFVNKNQFIFDPQLPVDLQSGGGGTGGNVPSPIGNPDTWLWTDGDKIVWKKLKTTDLAQPFAISGLSTSPSTLEIGATVSNLSFSYSKNETIVSAIMMDSQFLTNTSVSLTSPFTYIKTFSKQSIGGVSFTLTCKNAENDSSSSSTSINWLIRKYYGSSAIYDGIQPLEAFVKALPSSQLDQNRNMNYTTNCGASQKIYLAIPVSFGTPIFYVGGFAGGFHLLGNTNVTNQFNVTAQYQVWESDNLNLGNTTVSVQ